MCCLLPRMVVFVFSALLPTPHLIDVGTGEGGTNETLASLAKCSPVRLPTVGNCRHLMVVLDAAVNDLFVNLILIALHVVFESMFRRSDHRIHPKY